MPDTSTREAIVAAALRLFQAKGYDKTTMRAIAAEAGVSLGNAYYYFEGKDHLVQAFYRQSQDEHAAAQAAVLDGVTSLQERLRLTLRARIDTMAPYHAFAGSFFRTAADPASPLSPFSEQSTPARTASTRLYATVVGGSADKIPAKLRGQLPELLWLYQMGIVLFWVHDRSAGAAKTYALIDRTVPMIVKLIGLTRLPGVRGLLDDVLALHSDIAPGTTR